MKIIPNDGLPSGQTQVMALVAEALAQTIAPPSLQRFAVSAISADTPHAILEISLQDLADGQGLAKATRTGMRYLLRGAKAQVAVAAVADVGFNKAGNAVNRVKSLTGGEGLNRLGEALARAAAYPSPDTATTVELSLLRCRGVNVEALVLAPESGGEATLFPFIGNVGSLKGSAYTETAFFDALRPEARRVRNAFEQAGSRGSEPPVG